MVNKRILTIVIALTVIATLIGGTIPAAGQQDPDQPDTSGHLLEMLARVPDSEIATDGGGWATVRFADYQAYFIAEGIEDLRQTLPVEEIFQLVPLSGLSRIMAAPSGVQYMLPVMGNMDTLVGFEWFEDVITSLEFGQPPQDGLILGGDFDADAIAAALSTRESQPFESSEINGVTVWHRFEDSTVNITARDLGDPFHGELGSAARIAILPGYLANGRSWDVTEAIIAAAQGERDSLADDPDYRALAEAITAPEGVLIQALYFNLVDIGVPVANPRLTPQQQANADPTADYGPLLPYSLAVLADRQEDNDQVHLIALVYPDADMAADAAEEVARRARAFIVPGTDTVLIAAYGATISTRVDESESTGSAVAVIEARYPLPENRIDEGSGMFITSGLMFRQWIRAIMQREFFLLQVTAE